MPRLPMGTRLARTGRQSQPLGTQPLSQTSRPPTRTAAPVISHQRRANHIASQAAHGRQMLEKQIVQFLQRKFMRLAGRQPQPVTEGQKVIKSRARLQQEFQARRKTP